MEGRDIHCGLVADLLELLNLKRKYMKLKTKSISKGDLMKMIYSKDELRNIDSAIPIEQWETHKPKFHVMNYNKNQVFGKLENLIETAKKRKIEIPVYE